MPMISMHDAANLINSSREHVKIFGGNRVKSQQGANRVLSRLDDERRHLATGTTNTRDNSFHLKGAKHPWSPSISKRLKDDHIKALDGKNTTFSKDKWSMSLNK